MIRYYTLCKTSYSFSEVIATQYWRCPESISTKSLKYIPVNQNSHVDCVFAECSIIEYFA